MNAAPPDFLAGRESPPCFHSVGKQNPSGVVTRRGIDDRREPALGRVEVTGNQSTQRSLMKVAELELGGIHRASPPEQLEQLDRRRTTRHRDAVEMTPLEAMTCFRPHPTIR